MPERRLLVAPDKFKGTLTAPEVCAAVARAAVARGWDVVRLPLADGGEGTLEAFGGADRHEVVTGPLGAQVSAPWRLADGVAVIEAARANGLVLAGGAAGNDPERATTAGVGELVAAALEAGARRVLVGVGGSATTDGGLGAVGALVARGRRDLTGVEVCVDVSTTFVDAAAVFGPQKGADPDAVDRLTRQLARTARYYLDEFGVDVRALPGSGAAGGLAGGLAALGAALVPGLDRIAGAVGLDGAVRDAQLVVTGEGRLDATSLAGKVVGGVCARARTHGVPVIAVVGAAELHPPGVTVLDLSATYGPRAARERPGELVERVLGAELDRRG